MDEFEPVLSEAIVVCHVEGCTNAGVSVQMLIADTVICGPCGQTITDVTILPAGEPEAPAPPDGNGAGHEAENEASPLPGVP